MSKREKYLLEGVKNAELHMKNCSHVITGSTLGMICKGNSQQWLKSNLTEI